MLPEGRESEVSPSTVISALDDPQCRALLGELDTPRSVQEAADAANVPLSTTYRKIARLREASLVEERTEIRESGHHRTQYVVDFEQIILEIGAERTLCIDIARPSSQPQRQLAELWSEVRDAA